MMTADNGCGADRCTQAPGAPQRPDARGLARELLSHTRWSRRQLADYQRERLAGLIRHAVTSSPYYRQVLGPGAEGAPLHALPRLTRATLMRRWDDIVTGGRLRLDEVQAHLAGPHAAEPFRDHLVVCTSGSTGTPAVFVYSRAEMARAVAGLIRALALLGVDGDTRVLGIGAPSQISLSYHLLSGLRGGRAPDGPQVSVRTPLPELVRSLNAYQPQALPAVAGVAALLAEQQLSGGLRIAPRVVVTTSEVLAPDMRQRIRAAWGIQPDQLYATTEGAVMASTGPGHDGLRIWADQVILEVVDGAGRAVPPGTPGEKVLLTNLTNRVLPLIRYEISDRVTLAVPDRHDQPFDRIAAIDGRADELIMLPTPDGDRTPVHAMRLRAPFVRFPDVVQYRILHDPAGLTVSVVLRPRAEPDVTGLIRDALASELRTAGVLPPQITVAAVSRIEPGDGPLAKSAVIQSLSPRP